MGLWITNVSFLRNKRMAENAQKMGKKTDIVKKTIIYQQSGFRVKKFIKFNTFVKQLNSDI
ncbi:MAG TPA: hypothetical protein PK289_08575 [Bacteroidia bacterium]|jgi:hypothetical protein|nr:hypothetical protein [Bacteroidia bacterium]